MAPKMNILTFANEAAYIRQRSRFHLPTKPIVFFRGDFVNIYARLSFCVKLGQSLGFFMISPYLCTPKNKTKRKKALWNICLRKATMSSWLNFNTW